MKFIKGPVRWGIIGCGDVCEVKSGPAFGKVSESALIAVMRRDLNKAKDYAQRHRVSKFYSEAEQVINDPEINAIYIATPPAHHEAYAERALKKGKPVYIEKPVTLNSAACERLINIAKELQVPATVAHYRRALPLFQKVKELLQSNAIGTVRFVRITMTQAPANNIVARTEENWRIDPSLSGGGLFYDLSPHQLDIVYWLFGEPVELYGKSLNQAKAYNAPDNTSLTAIFKNDILLQGLWAFNAAPSATEDSCRIIGEKGMLVFPFFKQPVLEMYVGDTTQRFEFSNPAHIQQPMISEVVDFFRGKAPNPCSLEDALITMKMMDCSMA